MCNLYRLDKGQDTLRRFFKVTQDDTGHMPPLPDIFPDMMVPVILADPPSSNGEQPLLAGRRLGDLLLQLRDRFRGGAVHRLADFFV
jgi:putative SOS response-associated peptidase YedK